jgi:hypothetical protein
MKAEQNTIVRWVSKLVAKERRAARKTQPLALRVLDTQQLKQVGGGFNGGGDLPNKTW